METEQDDLPQAPIRFERMTACANEVALTTDGTRLARIPHGPDCGLTNNEARAYAALFAASPLLHEATSTARAFLSDLNTPPEPSITALITQLDTALRASTPLPKGKPFRRFHEPPPTTAPSPNHTTNPTL